MKRAFVNFDQPRDLDDDAKAKFMYQTCLNEYLELQKEYVSTKRKLVAAKRKKEEILAQVRFLRQKRKHLLESQAPSSDTESIRERNQSTSQVVVSNSHLRTGGNIHHKDARFKTKIKKPLVSNKGVGPIKLL